MGQYIYAYLEVFDGYKWQLIPGELDLTMDPALQRALSFNWRGTPDDASNGWLQKLRDFAGFVTVESWMTPYDADDPTYAALQALVSLSPLERLVFCFD